MTTTTETIESRALAWLLGPDTGVSSRTLCAVMLGQPVTSKLGAMEPSDPDDFGRCHRLLTLIPEWRVRLGEVADAYPRWRGLVDNWDELTALYLEELPTGKAPRCYKLIQQCRRDMQPPIVWERRRTEGRRAERVGSGYGTRRNISEGKKGETNE